LHAATLAVVEGGNLTVQTLPRVANRAEAMMAMAKRARAPIAFGAAPLRLAA
jgi:hypothetical protein